MQKEEPDLSSNVREVNLGGQTSSSTRDDSGIVTSEKPCDRVNSGARDESDLSTRLGDVSLQTTSGVMADDSGTLTLGEHLYTVKLNKDIVGKVFVTGLVLVDDWVYVTGWDQPHLYIYNISTTTDTTHTITGLFAVGMTLLNNTRHTTSLVITVTRNYTLSLSTNKT